MERLTAIQEAAIDHLVLKHFDQAEMSDAEWCKLTGIPQRTLVRWKNDEHPRYALFQSLLKQRVRDYDTDKDLVARLMRLKALEAMFDGMNKVPLKERRAWIKDLVAATDDVKDVGEEVSYVHMTREQLEDEMLARGLTTEDIIVSEIKGEAK